jgi:dienelactone hydrolase
MELLEPQVARSLCSAGYASIIADVNDLRPASPWPAWGGEDVNNRRAIFALKTVVDFAERVPNFDASRIGAIGLSLGGITTALWAGVDPRLKAAVVVVGGGNLPYILSHSDEPNVVDMREKRMQAAGLQTIEEFEQILRSNVMIDPFYFAPQADHHRILQILAESDTRVPYVVQREMFQAWGGPQSITFTSGHEFTIFQVVYFYMGDVIDFLNDRMKPGATRFDFAPITHKRVIVKDRPDSDFTAR